MPRFCVVKNHYLSNVFFICRFPRPFRIRTCSSLHLRLSETVGYTQASMRQAPLAILYANYHALPPKKSVGAPSARPIRSRVICQYRVAFNTKLQRYLFMIKAQYYVAKNMPVICRTAFALAATRLDSSSCLTGRILAWLSSS